MTTDQTADPRRVEYRRVTELQPDPRNPKAHATAEVKASIGRFGFIEPIALDGRTGYIISGHGRAEVLKKMEQEGENPPSGVKPDDGGHWTVPVVVGWESRTDTDAAGALIALNRTTELGGWVDEELLGLLDDLSEDDEYGFEGVGFTEADREALEHLTYDHEEDGPKDLDDLYESVGDVQEGDTLVRVAIRLPEELAQRFEKAIGKTPEQQAETVERWLSLDE